MGPSKSIATSTPEIAADATVRATQKEAQTARRAAEKIKPGDKNSRSARVAFDKAAADAKTAQTKANVAGNLVKKEKETLRKDLAKLKSAKEKARKEKAVRTAAAKVTRDAAKKEQAALVRAQKKASERFKAAGKNAADINANAVKEAEVRMASASKAISDADAKLTAKQEELKKVAGAKALNSQKMSKLTKEIEGLVAEQKRLVIKQAEFKRKADVLVKAAKKEADIILLKASKDGGAVVAKQGKIASMADKKAKVSAAKLTKCADNFAVLDAKQMSIEKALR